MVRWAAFSEEGLADRWNAPTPHPEDLLLRTFANLLFVLAWAGLAFLVVRALILTFVKDRHLAGLASSGVALAYILGAASPFGMHQSGEPPAASSANAPAAITWETPVAGRCRPGTHVSAVAARGSIDAVAVGAMPAAGPAPAIEIASGTPLHFVGWVALHDGPAESACVVVDDVVAQTSGAYGLSRPDVARAMQAPLLQNAGYSLIVTLPRGTHRVTIGGVAADQSVQYIARPLAVQVR